MAKTKQKKSLNCQPPSSVPSYYPTSAEAEATLKKTSDEELGRMYRQRKEVNDFLTARGLY